jgi:predicted RNA-binding Zn ribbon-like protein
VKLRGAIDTLLAGPDAAAIEVVNGWLAAPRLAVADGVLVLAEPRDARHALSEIALDAARLLTSPDRDRVKTCPNPDCGGRFVDRSPAGRRRWCSMAVCGNRAKAARHRATTH